MLYKKIIRPLLFSFDPERVHHMTFSFLKFVNKIPGVGSIIGWFYRVDHPKLEKELFGIKFPNPVGLAAGFDKDAKLFKELSAFGFGFIEIGTLTPKAQSGNPKKRLFRLKEDQAVINRMGFNNQGVDQAIGRLKKNKHVIIGGNIGKNKMTSNQNAFEDYSYCFNSLFDYVDYFVVNVSSPNTPNLRALQDKKPLTELLDKLQELNQSKQTPKPILLKIAPDLTQEQLLDIIEIVNKTSIDGVIATNTTLNRDGLVSPNKDQKGGLSGTPLKDKSTEVIRFLHQESEGSFPIVGVGGINSAADALEKLKAGASLVQVYTGFIYQGPKLIKTINKELLKGELN